jgi:oligopeptide transport system substrate-binding protein
MTARAPAPIAIATVLTLCTIACSGERSQREYYGTTKPRHGPDEVWTNLGTEPEYIDPGKCSDSAGGTVIFNLFAGLLQPHPATLAPMPDLARRWDISDDGLTYRFHLREAYWSDGVPITAHDFVYAWRRVLDRKTAAKYATFLYPLENAEAFHRGAVVLTGLAEGTTDEVLQSALPSAMKVERVVRKPRGGEAFLYLAGVDDQPELRKRAVTTLNGSALAGTRVRASVADASMVGVEAVDDRTLEVRLENPLPYILDLLMYYTAVPVPRHVIERLERAGQNPDLWTRPEHIVSNGAFVLEESKFRQYMVLRKNPRYWDAAHVKLERVRLLLVDSNNTTLNLYEAGELDYIGHNPLPSEFVDHLKGYADFQAAPYLGTYFFWLNTKAEPISDKRVRRALSLAVDRDSLVKYVTRGGQIPTADLVPDGVAGYRGLRNALFDPEKARASLREAGYGPDRPLPAITLRYNTLEGHKQIAEAVQQMWREHLGIRVEIENQEWKVYLKTLQMTDFQIARMGWIGDFADPFTFLELLMGANGNNHSNWSNAQYEGLLREANSTRDPAARLELLRRAEAIAMDELPVLPLYVYTRLELVKPYLMGHWLNYQHRMLFKYWWIDERWYEGPQTPLPNPPPPMMAPEPVVAASSPDVATPEPAALREAAP